MSNVIKFPKKHNNMSQLEELKQELKDKFLWELADLRAEKRRYDNLKNQVRELTIWDRIFNWPF